MTTPLAPRTPRAAAAVCLLALSGCRDTVVIAGDVPSDGDDGTEVVPSAPWSRDERTAPGSITVNELLYHDAGDADLEWIELHNPMAIDMDLSGWTLAGGVTYTFAEATILAAGGYLVVAADPSLLAARSGYADALGPYDGRLSDSGERIDLVSNGGRLIDTVAYGEDDPWPVHPDGSGVSLAKVRATSASDHAESWSASAEIGGTPGRSNAIDPRAPATTVELVALDTDWRYDASGEYPAADWADAGYDDGAWAIGAAPFYAGEAQADVAATVRVTADNYYGVYLGGADGADLRLVGEDPDGDWTTVESFDVVVSPSDHLYVAAWEAPSDYGGPQMAIAEVELPADLVGTSTSAFEWVLGASGDCPGVSPTDPPPAVGDLATLVADAAWASPAVDAARSSDPWGWALSSSFDADTRYVWTDTFDATSTTNTENTYALFRSVEPLAGESGTTELSDVATTTTFRTRFDFDGDPAAAELFVQCALDDGAVFHLNGVEALRVNMPAGPVDSETLATSAVTDDGDVYASLTTDALIRGENVLAVEVHQAEPDDVDLRFGCALTARISTSVATPSVVFDELAASSTSPFWVDLLDVSGARQDLGGLVLSSSSGEELVLPAGELDPDALLSIDDVGFIVATGDVLYLYSAERASLLDAVRVGDRVRGRLDGGGAWRWPDAATPGEPNVVTTVDDVVIHEIMYHRSPVSREGEPVTDRAEEWIELYNRGTAEIDLGGWQFVDAVSWEFPAGTRLAPGAYLVVANDADALRTAHPGITVLGDFGGGLANGSDRVVLLDARGNPADEVRYHDGGRWPDAADGGGSSLELRDPAADNTSPEVWAASDERDRAAWATYSYQGVAEPSAVGPDGVWNELVMGLLDDGEVLIDDVSVVQDPDTDPVELVQDGGFDDGDPWRWIGTHRHSEVVADPDDPANPVLRLVATGPTEHMHNHVETTLIQTIEAREYRISFRARWVSGSNQLHSRLYFNRLPRTTLVEEPALSGTPGRANSTHIDDVGPTFSDVTQDVAVPEAGEPVQIEVSVEDPDGVAEVTLWSSVGGAAFGSQAMTEEAPGHWSASLDGQEAGTIVQFYVEAEDGAGVTSTFPAAGPDSRALIQWNDGEAATNGLHNLRLLMTEADSDWLLDDPNLMSNDGVGATVVYDESEVFYDVEARAKGSERGRPETPRLGYAVRFHAEQPFRGRHSSVLLDRSEGVGYGQREVLLNLAMARAGLVSAEYNDLVHILTPRPEHTGPAELQLDRSTDLMLAAQFADGDEGRVFDYELVYYPLTTDDGTAEGQKLPSPDSVVGTAITDLGDDEEAYRWTFGVLNHERADDYDAILGMCQTFSLTDAAFLDEVDEILDVDQWLRAFAFATLSGAVDNYGGDGTAHNARFYVRPEDGRVLLFPHDLDYFGSATMAVVSGSDLARLLAEPTWERLYYQHLQDLMDRAYDADYLAPWCDQLAGLLPGQDIAGACQFIEDRSDWVSTGSSDAVASQFPEVAFAITTGGGADFSTSSPDVQLKGQGWIDVREIQLDGAPLAVTWTDGQIWAVTVPLAQGANEIVLTAVNLAGEEVGSDEIVVTVR